MNFALPKLKFGRDLPAFLVALILCSVLILSSSVVPNLNFGRPNRKFGCHFFDFPVGYLAVLFYSQFIDFSWCPLTYSAEPKFRSRNSETSVDQISSSIIFELFFQRAYLFINSFAFGCALNSAEVLRSSDFETSVDRSLIAILFQLKFQWASSVLIVSLFALF